MNKLELLKEKLRKQEKILATTLANTTWSGIVQRISASDVDFLILDLEHGTLNTEQSEEILRVSRLTGLPTVARVADALPHLISKIIDMGADGIILPRVESLEQVALAVQSLRFFPTGRKGCGGFSLFRPEESFQEINSNRLLFIQIESDEGITCLKEILENYRHEIAGVIIGPYDMSIMSGVPLQTKSERMLLKIRDIFTVSKAYQKSCGIFVDDMWDLEMWKEAGANIFWTGTELSLYCGALKELSEAFHKL